MYASLEATLHDAFWAAEDENSELALIEQFLASRPGSTLELGCGSGRLLLPLIESGIDIEGLDSSADMLRLCKAAAKKQKLTPKLHRGKIETLDLKKKYTNVLIPAFTLQLVDLPSIPSALETIREHMEEGGGLYLTTFIPWAELTDDVEEGKWFTDKEINFDEKHKATCQTRHFIQRIPQILEREHRYEIKNDKGKVIESHDSLQTLTWFWQRELHLLLASAGFRVEETIGDFQPNTPLDNDASILTTIAYAV
ncbi:class I SAM-dependent methyltransferase [Persicirhabdus sediminis]|uniref:Class I SAM-dependent methyltransferase n=1 Tax=Persicirhabdus sediminis TaxID=454144 RepID=A0A8J7MHA8_9BACT|nr:class I SAM-dependent methyltransferase [Persicirhabdus sediminis]MBK1792818.1 class I SAM-dependent methyltransferase [Persicirhabdus sediminis]